MTAPRSILVTGCSSGIGETCALGLHARGWRVFTTARQPDDLRRLEEAGLEAVHLDYREPRSIAAAVDQIADRLGAVPDALFNNGAYGQPGAVEDLPRDVLRAQFETNLFGWHELTCRLLPGMRARGSGRIVQCSSVLGLVAMKWRGAYNASKFALEGLTDTLRLELRGSGIHVSLIEPGPIASRFTEHALKAMRDNIDMENSPHAEAYRRHLARLEGGGTSSPFKLPPDAVLKRLVHALEAPRPKPRYYVTVPTYLMASLRRILPYRALDRVLSGASES